MKITVGGSLTFAKEQFEIKKKLENLGHKVLLSDDMDTFVSSNKKKN